MRAQLEKRIEALTEEYTNGEKMLTEVEQRRAELQQALLRISGAVQVLRELLGEEEPEGTAPTVSAA